MALIRATRYVLVFALGLALPMRAQSYLLSGPFPPGPGGGDVRQLLVSPDGTQVVYLADGERFGTLELYVAPVDGSQPARKLSGELVTGGNVALRGFAISPDGTRVVYRADQRADEVSEIFSVPIDGSASPVRLSADLATGGSVHDFTISADGSRVVYYAFATTYGRFELWSAPIDGSASAIPLDPALPAFASVGASFVLSATGKTVYVADAPVDGQQQLFSVPSDGSAPPAQLTQLPASSSIGSFVVTPDGAAVVYVRFQQSPTQTMRLFRVPTDGSAPPVELSSAAVSRITDLRMTPDGNRAVYLADALGNDVLELFSVPTNASASPVRLHAPLGAGQTVVEGSHDETADGSRVLFVADLAVDDVFELWSAPVDGSTPALRLNGALVTGGDVAGVFGVAQVPADGRVVYIADQLSNGVAELFSVAADGSTGALRLNDPLSAYQDVRLYSVDSFQPSSPFGPDPSRAVFAIHTQLVESEVVELYSVPVDATTGPVRLNGPLATEAEGVPSPGWAFAQGLVLYVADQDRAGMGELYGVALDGSPPRTKLNGPLAPSPSTAYVNEPQVTSDSARVLYLANVAADSSFELYSTPADGSGSPVRLNVPLPIPGPSPTLRARIDQFKIGADAARVVFGVYYHHEGGETWRELHSAPVDGSAAAVRLDAADYSTYVEDFELTPDGRTVVFQQEDHELLRVPADGSSAAVELLDPPADFARRIQSFRISPDGRWVVFVMDRDTRGVFELYSVRLHARRPKVRPIDRSDLPVKLSAPLVANGDVGPFEVSPDGARVVYVADQEVDERQELYSVSIGGGEVVRLNGDLVPGGDVAMLYTDFPFRIAAGGARVVYVADEEEDERVELFSVPIAGGARTRLNGVPPPNGDVVRWGSLSPFELAPGGMRVLYLADHEQDGRVELYIVPVAGGVPLRLNGELTSGGNVLAALISRDGRQVVYSADAEVDGRFQLYSRRSDGSGSPTKISGPLPGWVEQSFAISPDSRRVVYRGYQDDGQAVELYKVPIGGGPRTGLSGALVPGRNIVTFLVSPDGTRVVYTADQDTADVLQLYGSLLEHVRGPGPRAAPAVPPARHVSVGL